MGVVKNTFFWGLVCLSGTLTAQYIQVDDSYTAQQLVENVLIHNNPCAGVSNFSVSGDTFSGATQSYGYFSNNSPNFPFTEGIVLSTSRAIRTEGPNNNLIDEGSVNWQGDADVEQALGINHTFNATALEFDFTPLTSQISFDYIFASEEYSGTAPCHYSDGFAFLLKPTNSTAPYQNLAVIPNTNIPVLVTTVHPAINGSCGAQNEAYFAGYNPAEYPINFGGQTVVLTAKTTVIPGTTYHIKLAIADEENIRYDSAIFLGAGSFKVGTDLGDDRLLATNNPLCYGETYTLDATEPGSNTYKWFKNGVLISGQTGPLYTVSDSGIYTVEINLNGSGCIVPGEVTIEYSALPVLDSPVALVQCDDNNDGISTFDLTKVNNLITMGNTALSQPVYYENLVDAQNGINQIANPTAYQNTNTSQIIAKVMNAYGCSNYATVNLQIANNAVAAQNLIITCDLDSNQDGITAFDLAAQVTPQVLTGLPAGLVVECYASANEAILQDNPLPNSFTNTIANQQIIYARIVNGPDCYGIVPVTLVVNAFNPANFQDENVFLCDGTPETLTVASGFSGYLWSNGDMDSSTVANTPGIYTVTVANAAGCAAAKTFHVIASGIATITSVSIHDFSGTGNTVLVNFTGDGVYAFSLGGSTYQDSPLFTNVASGEYVVYVKDKNGCGPSDPVQIYVMDYPHYFTPNGDGFHDIWEIKNLSSQPDATVNIFDRYGKLVYSFKGNGAGWDGKLNAADLPSTDYWFTLILQNGRTVKSHFALKR
jgi:gliding motility-associated-like protein